jgi:tRNA/rRNA methyltransferase/tRNA (cytidine32/uridine32-2'-O)-methyltransferase
MKNLGLSRLRMAAAGRMDEELLRNRAIHAADVWENAPIFDTMAEAVSDCSLIVGTTRRRGRRRKSITMDPRTLAAWLSSQGDRVSAPIPGDRADALSPGKVAIVFGNERTGLNEAELDLCNIASHIPVSEAFPSINLSHAVQIYAYELFLALSPGEEAVKGEWTALDRTKADNLVESITGTLADIGFYKYPGREMQANFLRDVICRSGLTEREGKYLKDIFIKAARLGSMIT